jgi:metallothionein
MSEKKCANPACSCIPPDGQKFCSAHCESLKGSVEAMCDCGHPTCKGDVLEASRA